MEAPTFLPPEKRRATAVCGLSPKFGVQTLPAQLRDGEATGPLLDQPQHDKSLEASRIRLRLAMSKVEQLADFAPGSAVRPDIEPCWCPFQPNGCI